MSMVTVFIGDEQVPTIGPVRLSVADFDRADDVVSLRLPRGRTVEVGQSVRVQANGVRFDPYTVETVSVEEPSNVTATNRRGAYSADLVQAIAEAGIPIYIHRQRLLAHRVPGTAAPTQQQLIDEARQTGTDLQALASALREQLIRIEVSAAGAVSLVHLTDVNQPTVTPLGQTLGVQRQNFRRTADVETLTESTIDTLLRQTRAQYQSPGDNRTRQTPGDPNARVLAGVEPSLALALDRVARQVTLDRLTAEEIEVAIPLNVNLRPRDLVSHQGQTWRVRSVAHRLGPDQTMVTLESVGRLTEAEIELIFQRARVLGLPPAIENLRLGALGGSFAELAWDSIEASTVDGIHVKVGASPVAEFGRATGTNVEVLNLDAGATYAMEVSTVNELAASMPARLTVTTLNDFPPVPDTSFIAGYQEFIGARRSPDAAAAYLTSDRVTGFSQVDLPNLPERCQSAIPTVTETTYGVFVVDATQVVQIPNLVGIGLVARPTTGASIVSRVAGRIATRVLPQLSDSLRRGVEGIQNLLARRITANLSVPSDLLVEPTGLQLDLLDRPWRRKIWNGILDVSDTSIGLGTATVRRLSPFFTRIANISRFVGKIPGFQNVGVLVGVYYESQDVDNEGLYIEFNGTGDGHAIERWEMQWRWVARDGTETQPWTDYEFQDRNQPSGFPLAPRFGTELRWLDIRTPPTDAESAAIRLTENDSGLRQGEVNHIFAARQSQQGFYLVWEPTALPANNPAYATFLEQYHAVQFRARIVVDALQTTSMPVPLSPKPVGRTNRPAMTYLDQPDASQVRFRASCWHESPVVENGLWL